MPNVTRLITCASGDNCVCTKLWHNAQIYSW